MAKNNSTSKVKSATRAATERAVNKRREIKEVSTKLKNMGPIAKAEVVNQVFEKAVSKQFTGFVGFLREQSVIGLAIGIVIGTQVKTVVDALVAGFINPMVALLMPGSGDLAQKIFVVHRAGHGSQQFKWGNFVATLISFVIVALVIYFGFKLLKLDKLDKKKE
jgi:large conductance mechanosensitive channel